MRFETAVAKLQQAQRAIATLYAAYCQAELRKISMLRSLNVILSSGQMDEKTGRVVFNFSVSANQHKELVQWASAAETSIDAATHQANETERRKAGAERRIAELVTENKYLKRRLRLRTAAPQSTTNG